MEDIELLKTLQEIHTKCECDKCPLDNRSTRCGKYLCNYRNVGENAEEVIEICEKWRKDHPIKTYADVFFEQFPDALYDEIEGERIPKVYFDMVYKVNNPVKCGKQYDMKLWLQPYP